jgi:SNF2 family DNA or RNA helicase
MQYSVVCPVAVVSQWAAEIKKIAKDLVVVEHHGNNRATGMSDITIICGPAVDPTIDPAKLRTADVVITSYNIVASEHGTFNPEIKDEGKGKSKPTKSKSASTSDEDDSDIDDIARHLQRNKKPTSRAPKKKDVLFRVKWWRIILGAHELNFATLLNSRLLR